MSEVDPLDEVMPLAPRSFEIWRYQDATPVQRVGGSTDLDSAVTLAGAFLDVWVSAYLLKGRKPPGNAVAVRDATQNQTVVAFLTVADTFVAPA